MWREPKNESKRKGISVADLKVGRMTLGSFQTNCYYVYRESVWKTSKESGALCPVLVFDPAENGVAIYEALKAKGFMVAAILLTHGHIDHIAGVKDLKKCSGALVYACDKEADLLSDMRDNLSTMFGLPLKVEADEWLQDGKEYTIGDIVFRVIATPGHTVGSCTYYFQEEDVLISGDTLFEESVGRTDFPTGSMHVLVHSIKHKLFTLPEKTIVYPGHGGSTTIGWEKDNNPFII